jgi:hypothetical protein
VDGGNCIMRSFTRCYEGNTIEESDLCGTCTTRMGADNCDYSLRHKRSKAGVHKFPKNLGVTRAVESESEGILDGIGVGVGRNF